MPGSSFVIYDGDSVIRLTGTMTGGSGATVTDLGVVSAVPLLSGPVTLATPAAGSFFWPLVGPADYVLIDHQAVDVAPTSRVTASGIAHPLVQSTSSQASVFDLMQTVVPTFAMSSDGTPVRAYLSTDNNAYPVRAALAAWQANHAYATLALILGPDNHIWSANAGGGTSAGTIPNFAANEGGSVADGTVTWTDEGAIPTVGSFHLYALTA